MFIKFMARLGEIFPAETNLAASYESGSEQDNLFVQRLALFFCGFFKVSARAAPPFLVLRARFARCSLRSPRFYCPVLRLEPPLVPSLRPRALESKRLLTPP